MTVKFPPEEEFAFRSRAAIEAYQLERLQERVNYAWNNIPFYYKRWSAAGMEPGDIKTLADLNKIPTFTLDDLRLDKEANPPFGSYQGIAVQEASRIMTSGGTSGIPRPFFQTVQDWENVKVLWERSLRTAGVTPDDIVQVSFGISTLIAGPGARDAVIKMGATVIPVGTGLITPAEMQVQMAKEWGTTVWICTPTFAVHLGNVARKMGIDPRETAIRMFITAAEPLPPATRKRIDAEWGCKTIDVLGCVEAGSATGAECCEYSHIHIMEEGYMYQAIDLESGLPVAAGEDGVLVLTSIYPRAACPMIRYNTMDISAIFTESCSACGRNTIRIESPLKGRADDRIKFKGVYLYPPAVEEIIRADLRLNGEFMIIADRVAATGEDTLDICVECAESKQAGASLQQELQDKIKLKTGLRMRVMVRPEGEVRQMSLGFGGFKATHFVDRRPKS